jgi:GNAT superfamily N-acetyltransferase
MRLTIRQATTADLPAIHDLAERSVLAILRDHYTQEQLKAGQTTRLYQVESRLIEDGTYFVLELDGRIAAGSGWSHHGTFHPPGPEVEQEQHLADEKTAVMRASYVDPGWTRHGFATLLASVTETAATLAGFRRFEAMCTPPSEAMRIKLGYTVVERIQEQVTPDIFWHAALMRKAI